MAAKTRERRDDQGRLLLTVLCWVGLGIAGLDALVQPLPMGLTLAALLVAYLAGAFRPQGRRWRNCGTTGDWTSTC